MLRILTVLVLCASLKAQILLPILSGKPTTASLTWTLIDHKKGASTSLTATTAAANCTGADFIVAMVSDFADATVGTVTDSSSNTYTHLTNAHTTGDSNAAIWYVQAPTVTGSMTLSYTGAFPSLYMQCWSGSKPLPFDQQSQGTAGSGQPGSITPTLNGELVITGLYTEEGTVAPTIDGAYTVSDNILQGTSVGGAMAYWVQTTATATNPTWTTVGTMIIATIASFKVGP